VNWDGQITVDEAFDYAYNAVKATGLQTPTRYALDNRGHIALARNPRFEPLDFRAVPPQLRTKLGVLDGVAKTVQRREPIGYFIGLVGYWIEGLPYPASGLSVDDTATPNIRLANDGFETDAFFPPNDIQPETLKSKELTKVLRGDDTYELVKVRVRVRLADIWSIATFRDGTQVDLYMNPTEYMEGHPRFRAETNDFFRRKNEERHRDTTNPTS
jgi:hypothetical protein